MSEELEPCPLCGSEARFSRPEGGPWYVVCSNGEAEYKESGPIWHNVFSCGHTKAEAAEKWNTRAVQE